MTEILLIKIVMIKETFNIEQYFKFRFEPPLKFNLFTCIIVEPKR